MEHGTSELKHMKVPPFRVVLGVMTVLVLATCFTGCAMITEMANTPVYDDGSYSDSSLPPDPYYRGHSSDASAPGIR